MLLGAAGIGVSVFKIGALALIGDFSRSTREHTTFMNTVEGFFAVGAIVGPAVVATLLADGPVVEIPLRARRRHLRVAARDRSGRALPGDDFAPARAATLAQTLRKMRDGYALGFSSLIMLYVAVEVAIYVWMPTYLQNYAGPSPWLATYALTIFFVLRAAGRFLRRMAPRQAIVERGARRFLGRDPRVFRGQPLRRRGLCRLSLAVVRTVHVGRSIRR